MQREPGYDFSGFSAIVTMHAVIMPTHSTPMLSVLYIKCNYAVNLLKKQVVWVTNPFELKLYGNIANTKNSSSQRTIYLLR